MIRPTGDRIQIVRDELARLTGLGYTVFPIMWKAKKPLTKNGCKNATADMAQVDRWLKQHGDCNWAIAIPEGVIVLDIDTLDGGGQNPWPRDPDRTADLMDCGALANTPRKGRHYWYKAPPDRKWGNTSSKIAPKVDTRGPGGYVLVYPSATRDGEYSWVPGMELESTPDGLPEPPEWLTRELDKAPAKAGSPSLVTLPPAQCTLVYDKSTEVYVNTHSLWHKRAIQMIAEAGGHIGQPDHDGTCKVTRPGRDPGEGHSGYWNSPHSRHGSGKAEGDRYGYPRLKIFTGNWPPFEEGGSYSTYDIVRLLTPDQKEWQGIRNDMFQDHQSFWAAMEPENFYNPEEPADMEPEADQEVKEEAKKEAKVNTLIELAQSLAFNAREYSVWEIAGEMPDPVVPFLVSKGDFLTFIGQSKVGKTWVSMDMAISFACGVPWLGKFEPDGKKRVLFLDGEMKGVRLKERLMHIVQNRGLEFPADHLHFIPFKNNKTDLNVDALSLYEMAPKLKEIYQPDLVLIDNMRTFHPHGAEWYLSESDDKTMSYLARLYRDICDELGSALILTHHATKGEQSFKDVIDMGSGSGALGSQTDGQIVMRRVASKGEDGSPVRDWSLEATLRDWPGFGYTLEKDGPLYNITGEICDPDEAPPSNIKPAPNALPLPFYTVGDVERAFAGRDAATIPSLCSRLPGADTPNGRAHKDTFLGGLIQDGVLRENGSTSHKGVTHKLYSIVLNRQAEIDLGITGGQAL